MLTRRDEKALSGWRMKSVPGSLPECDTGIMWPRRKKNEQPNVVFAQKHTALTEAVLRSDYGSMSQVVATGADLNEFHDFRMTPLLWAILRGDIDAVRVPLEN